MSPKDASFEDHEIEVFYDSECPLCKKEIRLLRWLDRKRNKVLFTDIAAKDFRADDYQKTLEDFMNEIHGRLPDGNWIIGVEVFRRLYSAVGFGLLIWPTRLPGISHMLDAAYRVFARNRLNWTGRCRALDCDVPQA